jgi:hypothetical protein
VFVELLDRLRCPNDHADTWLVAAVSRTAHQRLIDATLGCPECGAEFVLRDGELLLGAPAASSPMPVTEDAVMRAAALLRLEERGLYLLDGAWGSLAAALRELLDVDLILADPPAAPVGMGAVGQGILRGIGDRWPIAGGALHGIALDRATPQRTTDAVRVLRTGGRLVAPASAAVPAGTRELARDERHWVAEKADDVVPLVRARR